MSWVCGSSAHAVTSYTVDKPCISLFHASSCLQSTPTETLRRIKYKKVEYPPQLSAAAVSFMEKALERDPNRRASIAEQLRHPWLLEIMQRHEARAAGSSATSCETNRRSMSVGRGMLVAAGQAQHGSRAPTPGKYPNADAAEDAVANVVAITVGAKGALFPAPTTTTAEPQPQMQSAHSSPAQQSACR